MLDTGAKEDISMKVKTVEYTNDLGAMKGFEKARVLTRAQERALGIPAPDDATRLVHKAKKWPCAHARMHRCLEATQTSRAPRDSHDVTTVTMAPGTTYAPTLVKGSDNGNGYAGGNYCDGATRFVPPNYGVIRARGSELQSLFPRMLN